MVATCLLCSFILLIILVQFLLREVRAVIMRYQWFVAHVNDSCHTVALISFYFTFSTLLPKRNMAWSYFSTRSISDWKRCCCAVCWRMGLDVPNKVIGDSCMIILFLLSTNFSALVFSNTNSIFL
jgi:hypothetical protein